MMKKLTILTMALGVVMPLIGCSEKENAPIPVASVELNESAYTLNVAGTLQLQATVLPEGAANKTVVWNSENKAVATVSTDGLVTAVATGEAKITVTTDDGGKSDFCVVTVEQGTTGVTLDETELLLMDTGETATLTATVLPAGATHQNVTWKSDNEAVATVENGVVTAVADGEATITVTTEEGAFTDDCIVTVSWIGKATFLSDKTWTVEKDAVSQTWSDAVVAVRCRKEAFDGGSAAEGFSADCRQNDGYGDLFSWAAVDRYRDRLCPDGWRVPTTQDFVDLDVAFGGSGGMRMDGDGMVESKYLHPDVWGGALSGYCDAVGAMKYQGAMAPYWAGTEVDGSPGNAYYMYVMTGMVMPQYATSKAGGYVVRCVK